MTIIELGRNKTADRHFQIRRKINAETRTILMPDKKTANIIIDIDTFNSHGWSHMLEAV